MVDNILACPITMSTIHSLRVMPAAFSDHMALRLLLGSLRPVGHSVGSGQGLAPVQPPRMHPSLIKTWCETTCQFVHGS